MDVNPDKLNAFMGKMLGDVGAAMNASLMLIGDKLGLYKTLSAKGPLSSAELAQATNTSERYVREWLAAQAASGYVEPFAGDRLEDNLNPVGRIFYAASTMICTPASLDQEVGLALGAQAGEARLREVASKAGLTRFRRASETAFNLILEATI